MNQENKNFPIVGEPDKTNRIGLWVSLSAAAVAAMVVLALAFYANYENSQPAVQVEPVPVVAASAPSSIPTSEAQAASIAAATSDEQSQGMTAPSDVGDASESEAPVAAAVQAAASASETPPASGPAQTILAEEHVANGDTRVVAANGEVEFHFATGKADLAANTLEALKSTVEGVKAGKKAVITSFADAEANAALTKERALAVRSVLLASGVPESSIEIKEPQTGGGNSRLVKVTLQ